MNYIWSLVVCLIGLYPSANSWAQTPDTLILTVSQPAGFYNSPVSILISCNQPGATIYYSTNGVPPSASSNRFNNPIRLDSTTVLQAVAYKGTKKSQVLVSSYIFNENTKFPVVSLAIDPNILFGSSGVFTMGPRASRKFPHFGANYYSNKEFPCHFEFFETDRTLALSDNFAFKIFGGMSRIFPQKSLAITAREIYGPKRIKHAFFPDRPFKSYKSIILRNSGSDFGETHFRDAFITSLGREMGLEVQAYRPTTVYINGKYWGILNLREKLNKWYIKDHFGYHKDSIDFVEHQKGLQAGTRKHYDAMRQYMQNNDLADQKHFDHVAKMMDVENFLDYEIVEIYIDNQDAGGNIKFWHPQTPDGRWRWILFDTDFGFGHYGRNGYKNNSLAFHTEPNGPAWPNPAWSTFNLRMLLKNKACRDAFVVRFADRMNTVFDSTHVIQRIDSMANNIRDEIPRHIARWDLSLKTWHTEIERMKEFARQRPQYMRQHLREMFPHIGSDVRLRIEIQGEGSVVLNNTVAVSKAVFEGIYFENLPVTLTARPSMRSQFSHWENMGKEITDKSFKLNFKSTTHVVKAVFKNEPHPYSNVVVINEIACKDSAAGDWIEFYNPSSKEVNLKGWTLVDNDNNKFTFPDVTLKGDAYLVVCQDLKMFKKTYPQVTAATGDFQFGLDKQTDQLQLFDQDGAPVDSVGYSLVKSLKGENVIISLKDCHGDNGNANSWKLEEKGGSPALINPNYVAVAKDRQMGNIIHYVMIGGVSVGVLALMVGAYVSIKKRMRRR